MENEYIQTAAVSSDGASDDNIIIVGKISKNKHSLIEGIVALNIYDKMEETLRFNDIIMCGQQLIEFADAARLATNRRTIIKHFGERLRQTATTNYVFSRLDNNTRYYICEKSEAIGMYILFAIGAVHTPVKTLANIKQTANHILANYMEPVGEIISMTTVSEIMECLDSKYSFSEKVFNHDNIIFAIIPYSHREFNSECMIADTNVPVVCLYHMNERGVEQGATPIAVFFHELGHVLHIRCFGSPFRVPNDLVDFLSDLCFPTIKDITESEQNEIFADVLSIGLMQGTKYGEYDLFKEIHSDDKRAFKAIVEKLLKKIESD